MYIVPKILINLTYFFSKLACAIQEKKRKIMPERVSIKEQLPDENLYEEQAKKFIDDIKRLNDPVIRAYTLEGAFNYPSTFLLCDPKELIDGIFSGKELEEDRDGVLGQHASALYQIAHDKMLEEVRKTKKRHGDLASYHFPSWYKDIVSEVEAEQR